MGQEASMPVPDGQEADYKHSNNASNTSRAGPRAAKALGNIIRRGHEGVEYNDRETARAAAAGGHFSVASTDSEQYPASQMTPGQQQQQQQQQQQAYNMAPQQHAYAMQQQQYKQNGNGIPPPPSCESPRSDAAVTVMMAGVDGKTSKNTKLPGTRLINSMKNLAINAKSAVSDTSGHSVKSPGTDSVSDWQRQWEDDDESDGEEEQEDSKLPASPLRPGMDDGYFQAAASIPNADPRIVGAAPLSPTRTLQSATMPKTPTRDGVMFEPPSKPVAYTKQESDGVEWDTGAQQMMRKEKPSIEMFLPMLRVLGKGSFGKVVLVQKNCGGDVGQLFAMKILKKEYLKKRRQVERTQTERKVLQAVNHPFIMKMHYAFQSEDKLFFVLDYCAGGELFFHLSRFRRFPERVARFYTSELLLAIGHLHKRGIIYRDLKPENVLIDADGHIKLGDFGLAKTGIDHPCEGALSMCGTPEYMAPEVLLQTGHGFCVDYWGLGMLVYEMMTGLPPWYTTDRAKLFRRLKSAPLEIPSFFSEQCASCVSGFLERSPRRRLGYRGLKSAMEHPFFRPINFRALYARRIDPPIRPCDGWSEQDALAAINSPNGGESETRDALDRATANFDQTFTTMPVDQEDDSHDEYDDGESYNSHDDKYVGFTYDDDDFQQHASSGPSRQRTQHGAYHHSTKK